MLGRSAFLAEVLIIHLCLMGNESTIYSKHPFEREKHIEMNFVTKLEPFLLFLYFCINSSFLSCPSHLVRGSISPLLLLLSLICWFLLPFSHTFLSFLSWFMYLWSYIWHWTPPLCCLSSIFMLYPLSFATFGGSPLSPQYLVFEQVSRISCLSPSC